MLEDINNILIFVWCCLIPSFVFLVKHLFRKLVQCLGYHVFFWKKIGLVDCCFSATCKKWLRTTLPSRLLAPYSYWRCILFCMRIQPTLEIQKGIENEQPAWNQWFYNCYDVFRMLTWKLNNSNQTLITWYADPRLVWLSAIQQNEGGM